jgi:O-acetyl-ADP-ribose deacetylase (regulator of RNase III)
VEHDLASLAFPAISTGVYRFPPERAASIAVGTIAVELARSPGRLARVVLCCFAVEMVEHYRRAISERGLAP